MGKGIFKITVLVVLVGLLGWAGYDYYFGPDPELQTTLKSEFGEGFFTFDYQGGGADSSSNNSNSTTQPTAAPTPASPPTQPETVVDKIIHKVQKLTGTGTPSAAVQPEPAAGPTQPPPQPQPGQAPTAGPNPAAAPASQPLLSEAEIMAKYQPRLEGLERQCNGRLADLAAAAQSEYNTRKANGTLNKNEMVKKYIQAGEMLESGADASFYSLLNAMQAELSANGQPTTVVTDIEARYQQAKTQRRDALLSQAGLK